MTLRRRVSIVAAAAVALAVAVAVIVSYEVVRDQLTGQVKTELTQQAERVAQGMGNNALNGAFPGNPLNDGGRAPYYQAADTAGQVVLPDPAKLSLPVTAVTRRVASGQANNVLSRATVRGVSVEIYTFRSGAQNCLTCQQYPVAVQLARPLTQVDSVLSTLRLILILLFLACIALAAGLGRLAARRVLRPLADITATAQTIGETDDLSLRLAVHADDEVGQLATRFNAMLQRLAASRAALDDSVRSQRQLVADASHELRTPVTSLRTNIEVLLEGGRLDEEDRRRLLADVVEQSEELTTLVSDLIEVARGDLPEASREETRLDRVVEESLARARRNAPGVTFSERLEPVVVTGSAERLSRAINNLLDNASRHTAPGQPVEVTVTPAGVEVRDHGSGIAETDLPYVFDRFYRGVNSRSMQGSGLGLAIVRQVAESHGGGVCAENAPDGGARFTLQLPGHAVEGQPDDGGAGAAGDPPDDAAPDAGDGYGAGGLVTRA